MRVEVTSRSSCQPIGTVLEVSEKVVAGELTGQPMHEIVGGDLWADGKNANAKFVQSRFFEKI